MQDYLGSRPQSVRGASGHCQRSKTEVVSELVLWSRSMAKGASEGRLAHLLICWRWTPGSPETTSGSDG